jgi:hypothetical protein
MKPTELKHHFEMAQEVSLEPNDITKPDAARQEMNPEEIRRGFDAGREVAVDGREPALLPLPSEQFTSYPPKTEPVHNAHAVKVMARGPEPKQPQPPRLRSKRQYSGLKAFIGLLVLACSLVCVLAALIDDFEPTPTSTPAPSSQRFNGASASETVLPAMVDASITKEAASPTATPTNHIADEPKLATPPATTVVPERGCPGVEFDHGICLVGGTLPKLTYVSGEKVTGSLTWSTDRRTDVGYTVFVHLTTLDSTRPIVQHDGLPANGSRATTTWQPGESIQDPHELYLPSEIPPGQYLFRVGMYEGGNGRRLQVVNAGGARVIDDAVILGPIWVN